LITNPQPAWLPILLLALPGIILAACAANRAIFGIAKQPRSTIPVISLMISLVPAHLAALAFGSLSYGLLFAWTPLSLAGMAWGMRHRQDLDGLIRLNQSDRYRLGLMVLATLPVIAPTLLCNFWDEDYIGGHQAIIAQLQNGAYPPRDLYAPWLPLRYHYAFDFAAAIVTGIFRIRPDQAIDVLTLILWPLTFLLLWRLGSHVGGPRAGPFVAFSACFAGSLPLYCSGDYHVPLLTAIAHHIMSDCKIGSERISGAPIINSFFQHPWSLGLPIFALTVLEWSVLREQRFRAVVAGFMLASLALLSLAEVVLFITTVTAMGVVELWSLVKDRDARAASILSVLVASLPIAKVMGGFVAYGAYPSVGGLFGTGILPRELPPLTLVVKQLLANFESFGIQLLLGPFGLAFVKRKRLFLATLAGIGIAIMNLFRYKFTWDIVKFGTVSFFVLALASGVGLAEFRRRALTVPRKLGFIALLMALAGQGMAFPLVATLVLTRSIRPYFTLTFPIDPDEAAAVSYLRTHMGPSDIVFRNRPKHWPYAVLGGLPYFLCFYCSEDQRDDPYGLGEELYRARIDLKRISEDWVTRLSRQNVNWIVSDASETQLNAVLDSAVREDTVSTVKQFGQIRISRLNDPFKHVSNR
jgi:hypothetical protein